MPDKRALEDAACAISFCLDNKFNEAEELLKPWFVQADSVLDSVHYGLVRLAAGIDILTSILSVFAFMHVHTLWLSKYNERRVSVVGVFNYTYTHKH